MNTLQVKVDKSHLVTIGEKFYADNVELVREIVNNIYDADAAHVEAPIANDSIAVAEMGREWILRDSGRILRLALRRKLSKINLRNSR